MIDIKENKRYINYNISSDSSIFEGYYQNYTVAPEVLSKLSKDLGFSLDLYSTLRSISSDTANSLVASMSKKNNISEISLLIDEEEKLVVNYSLEAPRTPILNNDFIKRTLSIAESCDFLEVSEVYYSKDDTTASVIFKRKEPIIIEEKNISGDSNSTEYYVGTVLINDELNSAYSRLVLYLEDQPLYLPSSFYNSTTSRFKRSTNNSPEALEVLLLKVVDDLRGDELYDKIYEFHFRYRANKDTVTSYEEYNTVLRTMRKIPTIIDDNSFLESLVSRYENFEKRYQHLEDQKSSYIWRCTAMSDITIGALVSLTSHILSELNAPALEYFNIRDLLGSYISTNRIAAEIAKEDIE